MEIACVDVACAVCAQYLWTISPFIFGFLSLCSLSLSLAFALSRLRYIFSIPHFCIHRLFTSTWISTMKANPQQSITLNTFQQTFSLRLINLFRVLCNQNHKNELLQRNKNEKKKYNKNNSNNTHRKRKAEESGFAYKLKAIWAFSILLLYCEYNFFFLQTVDIFYTYNIFFQSWAFSTSTMEKKRRAHNKRK